MHFVCLSVKLFDIHHVYNISHYEVVRIFDVFLPGCLIEFPKENDVNIVKT